MERRRFLRALGLAPIVPFALKGMDWSTPPAEAAELAPPFHVGEAVGPAPMQIPAGTILAHFGEIPEGWLLCNGQSVNIKKYPHLYAAIGERYGSRTYYEFRVPDLRGRTSSANTGTHSHGMIDPAPSSHTHSSIARADHNHTLTVPSCQYLIKV